MILSTTLCFLIHQRNCKNSWIYNHTNSLKPLPNKQIDVLNSTIFLFTTLRTLLSPYCDCSEAKLLSRVRLFATAWTVARQAPLSMGFSSQEYWNGLPFPSPGDIPGPGIEPGSPALQADSLPTELHSQLNLRSFFSSCLTQSGHLSS